MHIDLETVCPHVGPSAPSDSLNAVAKSSALKPQKKVSQPRSKPP